MKTRLLKRLRARARDKYRLVIRLTSAGKIYNIERREGEKWLKDCECILLSVSLLLFRGCVRREILASVWRIRRARFVAMLVAFVLGVVLACCSCTAGKAERVTQYVHDTITRERVTLQCVNVHDTITIHDTSERDEIRVIYDTLERVREVVKTAWRTRVVTEQGTAQETAVKDTTSTKKGTTTHASKESKPQPTATRSRFLWGVFCGCCVCLLVLIVFGVKKKYINL